ncbi:hypothetical protein NMY22_g25 [Coprinellus aureogranulatus]|nr:hypothetical protein NMY22_g25 [Coprinellus aureogranulatus]
MTALPTLTDLLNTVSASCSLRPSVRWESAMGNDAGTWMRKASHLPASFLSSPITRPLPSRIRRLHLTQPIYVPSLIGLPFPRYHGWIVPSLANISQVYAAGHVRIVDGRLSSSCLVSGKPRRPLSHAPSCVACGWNAGIMIDSGWNAGNMVAPVSNAVIMVMEALRPSVSIGCPHSYSSPTSTWTSTGWFFFATRPS